VSGHPEFYEVRNGFYKDADGILVVFDVTQRTSLDGLDVWLREAHEFGAINLPTFIVANKVKNVYINVERLF
jgi:GTPase SAR1 family protein